MPPKDGLDLLDGTLYFADENGEFKPLCKIYEVSEVEITEGMDAEALGDGWFQFANAPYTDHNCEDLVPGLFSMQPEYHFGFDLDNSFYKMLIRINKNNYRRLHGLRPIRRKVQRHKPKINAFTLKRIRGGFKFR